MNFPSAEIFSLLKFAEESNFRKYDKDMNSPQKQMYYEKGNPRIRMENGKVVVWNDHYQTSLCVERSVFEVCTFTKPPVLSITCAETDTRIICFVFEGTERTLTLAQKFNIAKEYREMTQVPPFTYKFRVLTAKSLIRNHLDPLLAEEFRKKFLFAGVKVSDKNGSDMGGGKRKRYGDTDGDFVGDVGKRATRNSLETSKTSDYFPAVQGASSFSTLGNRRSLRKSATPLKYHEDGSINVDEDDFYDKGPPPPPKVVRPPEHYGEYGSLSF
jgi:hypothetical protein